MMRYTPARLLAAGALMAFACLAQAQYMWIDEKGLKVFSDRAPPPSIPLKNILKAPHGAPSAMDVPADQPAAAPAPEASKPKTPSMADRDADYRKRTKETEERQKKDLAEAENKAAKAESCDRARSAKQTIESGVRISTHDKNGERGYMTDEQRAAEAQKADRVLAACN